MITYLLDTLVNSIKTSLINKLGLDPSTEVDLDDFPQLIDDIPILDSVEELTVTENGTYTGTEGVTYNPVNVNLPLGSKSVTANGTYTASDDSLQGYSSVTVDIDDTDLYRDTTDSTYESVKTLSNCGAFPMLSLKVGIEPQQDLHGYDAPWAGGAGKNKFDIEGWLNSSGATYTKSGNTYTISAVGALFSTPFTFSDTDVAISASASSYVAGTATFIRMELLDSNNSVVGELTANSSYQKKEGLVASKVRFNWSQDGTFTITEPQIELGSTATSYAPYSNICPISGWDEANITVADDDTDPTVSNTYTIDLDGTRYGGTLDVLSGLLTITDGYIASYNGETLPSTWISDRDVYAEGSTPTTGAEVCYEIATPLTIQLTPTQVKSLLGSNNIWADTGDVGDVRYFEKVEL